MIENITNDIHLPTDVQNAIIAARNNVSVLEAEAQRMERLIGSQKRELSTLGGALADINTQIDTITERRENLSKEITTLEKEKTSLKADIAEMEKRNSEARAEIDLQQQSINERTNVLSERERAVYDLELALAQRIKDVEIGERTIASKKLTLSEALAQL